MSRSDEERIQDILEISEYLQILVNKGEDYFFEDITHQWAIERTLQNIGEACTKISDEFKSAKPEVDWKSILGMRTYLAHVRFPRDSRHRFSGLGGLLEGCFYVCFAKEIYC